MKRLQAHKKIIDIIIFNILVFLLLLLTVYKFPKTLLFKDYNYVEITALAEKNEAALGQEVWFNNIIIDDEILNINKIDYDDKWIISNDKLVFVGSEKSTIIIKYPSYANLKINFSKHTFSGKVNVVSEDINEIYDLYAENYDDVSLEMKSNIKISPINIILSTFAYFIIFIILELLIKKIKKLLYLGPFVLYFILCFLLSNNNITYIFAFSFMFLSYFTLCKKNNNKYLILIPFLIYLFSLIFIVPYNFRMVETSNEILYVFVNISFITILLYLVYFFNDFLKKIINNNLSYKRWLFFIIVYIIINLIFLLIIWPGNWIWDEKGMFLYAQQYMYNGWQSYLMVLFYSWALMLCPFMVGIVIFQIIIVSFIFGYILNKIYELSKSKLFIFILFVLLTLPPVILNILYPLRATLYSSLELLCLFQMFYLWQTKTKINFKHILFFSFCIIFLSFWRTEGIYYLIMGPLALILIFKNDFNTFGKISKICFCLLFFGLIYSPLKILDKAHPNIYGLTIFPNALSMMLQEDLNMTDQEYKSLNKVFDIDVMKQYPAYHEVPSFNYNIVKEDYKEHMTEFIIAYGKIVLKNPFEFIKARNKTFMATTGMDKKYINNSPWGIYEFEYTGEDYEIINMVNNDRFAKPINYEFRNKAIHFFKGAEQDSYDMTLLGQIVWNFLPMLLSIIIGVIYYLIKKKYALAIILTLCFIKVPLIYITAPANYFFYYLSIYLVGLFVIGYFIYYIIQKIKIKCYNINKN